MRVEGKETERGMREVRGGRMMVMGIKGGMREVSGKE